MNVADRDSEWFEDIKKPIYQYESDVVMYFFNYGDDTTVVNTLTKKDLTYFKYKQSGSIINDRIPLKEVSFEVIKKNGVNYDLPMGQVFMLGFILRSDTSSPNRCLVGCFKIVDKENDPNQLTISYVANNQFVPENIYRTYGRDLLSSDLYKQGSNQFGVESEHSDATLYDVITRLCTYNQNYWDANDDDICGKSMPVVRRDEGLQMCATAEGRTLTTIKPDNFEVKRNNLLWGALYIPYTAPIITPNTIYPFNILEKAPITTEQDRSNLRWYSYKSYEDDYWVGGSITNAEIFGGITIGQTGYLSDYEFAGFVRNVDPTKIWLPVDWSMDYGYAWLDGDTVVVGSDDDGYPNYVMYSKMKTEIANFHGEEVVGCEEIVIENPLINENYDDRLTNLRQWVLTNHDKLKVKGKIDPRLELFDTITFNDGNIIYQILIEEINIEFNGTFLGNIVGRLYDRINRIEFVALPLRNTYLVNEEIPVKLQAFYGATLNSITYYGTRTAVGVMNINLSKRNPDMTTIGKKEIMAVLRVRIGSAPNTLFIYISTPFEINVIPRTPNNSPVIVDFHIRSATEFSITIANLTGADDTLDFFWSNTDQEMSGRQMANGETITLTYDNTSEYFHDAIAEYVNGQLQDDFCCEFDVSGDSVIILEAN